MLKPEYFEGKEQRLIEIYRQLEDFILSDIAERLLTARVMSGTADRMLYKLRIMGESQREIKKRLRKLTGLSRKELKALLQDAVMTSWEWDRNILVALGIIKPNPLKNPAVIRLMDAQYKKSQEKLWNLTQSTMDQAQVDLINMLDEADMRVAAGVQSYSAAVCDILDRYAGKGIEVLYPTGTKRTLEAAVMCCVRTSMVQMAGQVTMEYVKEAGTNLIITSAHIGARFTEHEEPANHMSWQGRVFYVSDADLARFTEVKGKIEENGMKAGGSENKVKYPDFVKTCGYGTGEGICGYNCRHSFGPYDERLGNPWRDKEGNLINGAGNRIDSEESKQEYRNSQKLRAMERAIRKTKTQLLVKQKEMDMVAETDVKSILQKDYDKLAYKLRQQNKAFHDFAETNDLRKQYDRLKVSGFNRKQSSKANGAATRYAKQNEDLPKHRSKKELMEAAQEIKSKIEDYAINSSKWSEHIVVDNSLANNNILGEKRWNCDIALNDTVDNGTIWHEMLHSCSASHYPPEIYFANRHIEEATVEFLKQQICLKEQIDSVIAYQDKTTILSVINNKFKYGTNMEFAKELFNISLPLRYQWLEDKVAESLRSMGVSFEIFYDVMHFVEELKGGKNE